jgi:sortase B
MKKRKRSKLIYVAAAVMLVFAGAFGYFAYDYFLYWQDGRAAQGQTDTVRDMFQGQMDDINRLVAAAARENGGGGNIQAQPVVMTIAFDTSPLDNAREMTGNPDIVGFLFVEGTNITNVILQGRDNYFYLHRDMFGNHNVNGSVFMDFRNSPDFTDQNTILYGHNMNNGTMFHNVRYYMRREFFEEHPYIKVITDEQLFVYEVFSAFSTRVDRAYRMDFDYIQVLFEDDEEFGSLVDEMARRSVYYTGVTAGAQDRMLVLSTCTNVQRNTRYVVAARLAQIYLIEN